MSQRPELPPYPPMQTPTAGPSQPPLGSGKAIASFVLGIIGLLAWCIPLVGLPVTIVGLVLGIKALPSQTRGLAIAGIVLCIVGLVGSIANAAVGAYMGATGQLWWQKGAN